MLCLAQPTLCIFSLLLKLKIESRNYEGAFSQEYLAYCKKKGRNQSAKDPGCAEGGRIGVSPIKKEAALDCDTSDFSHSQGLLLSVLGI